jgi:hypothetical protein
MTVRIDDGFSTTVDLAANPSVHFWEKTVTPPGVEGGGANDTSTMRNTAWRTKAPKKLKTLSDGKMTVAYDPEIYDDVLAMVQVNQLITVNFADGDTLAFWGWIDSFVPGAAEEGSQPTAEVTFIPSNQDDTGAEVAPVRTPAA